MIGFMLAFEAIVGGFVIRFAIDYIFLSRIGRYFSTITYFFSNSFDNV
jgi:hypothetical protein